MPSGPFAVLKKYDPPSTTSDHTEPVQHVHTEICWQDSFECAKWKVQQQAVEIHTLKITLSKIQLTIREAGSLMDKIDQALIRALQ
jgi:hypothetical protein